MSNISSLFGSQPGMTAAVETYEAAVRLAGLLTESSNVELGGGEGIELRRAMAPVTKAEES